MKKLYVIFLIIVVYCFLAVAMNNKISREMLEGVWNVKIANAPYGYQDLILDIKEGHDEYKVDILYVDSKNKISDREFKVKNGKLTGNINMDNEKRIDITIWEEKGTVKGKAEGKTIGGKMPITMTRPKE
jgi:hypothetical protein